VATTPNQWLSVSAVCADLGVSRGTLNAWRRDGRFPSGKRLPNNSVRFAASDVAAFLDSLVPA
jgi:predicted DNA-binding transcriptional regulator AlpA